jgi:hypothetical protein
MFTGRHLDAATIQQYINSPKNAMNLHSDTHDSMDKRLAWGIQAEFIDQQVSFYDLAMIMNSHAK